MPPTRDRDHATTATSQLTPEEQRLAIYAFTLLKNRRVAGFHPYLSRGEIRVTLCYRSETIDARKAG